MIFKIFTKNEIIKVIQVGEKENKPIFQVEVAWIHNFDEVPVFHLGGKVKQKSKWPYLYRSFISGILPSWNKAVMLLSDLDAQYVLHMYLEKAEMQVECDEVDCRQGKILVKRGDREIRQNCGRCKGTGFITSRSPFGTYSVKEKAFEDPALFPGIEYITKPTEIVTVVQERIDQLKKQGYEAVNMEFLAETPADESGKAKEFDRAELDGFLSLVSDRLFWIIENGYHFINLYRYLQVLTNTTEDNEPLIIRPVSFDVTTSGQVLQELRAVKENGMSGALADELQVDLIDKRLNSPEKTKRLKAIIQLDPLRGKSEDDKVLLFNSGRDRDWET